MSKESSVINLLKWRWWCYTKQVLEAAMLLIFSTDDVTWKTGPCDEKGGKKSVIIIKIDEPRTSCAASFNWQLPRLTNCTLPLLTKSAISQKAKIPRQIATSRSYHSRCLIRRVLSRTMNILQATSTLARQWCNANSRLFEKTMKMHHFALIRPARARASPSNADRKIRDLSSRQPDDTNLFRADRRCTCVEAPSDKLTSCPVC